MVAASGAVCLQSASSPAFFGMGRNKVDGQKKVPARFREGQLKALAVSEHLDIQAVAQLRGRVESAGFLDVPEGLLQRCHRAAGGDVEQAYVQLRDILRWRKQQRVGEILDLPGPAAAERWYRGLLQYGLPGRDRRGRAVMIEAIGQWDMDELAAAAREQSDAMVQAHIVVCEALLKQAQDVAAARSVPGQPSGTQRIPGFVAILDMEGIALRHNPMAYPDVLNVLKEVSKINARYYPEAVEHVFIVNAPGVFRSMWKVLAPFVLPSSGVKVDVLPKGEHGALLRECGGECLPVQLGGSLPAATPPYGP